MAECLIELDIEEICQLFYDSVYCRDLKPNNLLLGDRGHVILTYFSQWNSVDQEIDQNARDHLYVAPGLLF